MYIAVRRKKWCAKCKIAKSVSSFYIDRSGSFKDGRDPYCIECRRKMRAKKYWENPEKYRAIERERGQLFHLANLRREPHGYKVCPICKLKKSAKQFYLATYTKTGMASYCQTCSRKKQLEYRQITIRKAAEIKKQIKTKVCRQCKRRRHVLNFYPRRGSFDGFDHLCVDCRRVEMKKYRDSHPDIRRRQSERYYKKYRDEIIGKTVLYRNAKRLRDPAFRIEMNLRGRMYSILIGKTTKGASSQALIGCSREKLLSHLENQWKNGMSWENYGRKSGKRPYWEIDHKSPPGEFDLTTLKGQKAAFNYKNLRPLWQRENIDARTEWASKAH